MEKKDKKKGNSSFQGRRFKNGSYSAVLIVIAIAIVIVANMIVGKLPTKYTKLDVTGTKLFSIDEQSKRILTTLSEDITIYYLVSATADVPQVKQLLEKYEEMSKHIKVVEKDPALYPTFGDKYEATSDTVMIVESGKRYKLINGTDVYTITNQEDAAYGAEPEYAFNGEGLIANAVHYVTTDHIPIIYTVTGHEEVALDETIKGLVAEQSMELKELNLLTSTVPEDASCILLSAPGKDYNEEEAKKVIDYLEAGGNAVILADYVETDLKNFTSIIENYGVTLADGIIYEGNSNYAYNYPYNIVPEVLSHQITEELYNNHGRALLSAARAIEKAEDIRDTVTLTDLLKTSSDAFIKANPSEAQSAEKEKGDVSGQFVVGMAITEAEASKTDAEEIAESTEEEVKTKIALFTSSALINPTIYQTVMTADVELFLNALGWMCDYEESITIEGKNLQEEALTITDGQAKTWMGVYMALPMLVIAGGIFVSLKRRRA